MKKLFTLLAFLTISQMAFAGSGVYFWYLDSKLNGVVKTHSSGGTAFNGDNLGTVSNASTPLVLDVAGIKTYKNSGSNVTGNTLFYRVYLTGATMPSFSSQNIPFFLDNVDGTNGNQEWQNGADINLLAAANMVPGTYKVEAYFTSANTDGGAGYASMAAPFTATFVISGVTLGADLSFFSAKKNATSNQLLWLTASEKDNGMFQIERSANATDFSPIGEVKGAGNSNSVKNYTFTDATPLSGVNYYRLKAVDYNGSATLSKVVSVNFSGKSGDKTAVSPNPTPNILRVEFTAADASTTTLQVTDLLGRVLLSQNVSVVKGANVVPFNVASLPSGAYLLKANGDITRFVKM